MLHKSTYLSSPPKSGVAIFPEEDVVSDSNLGAGGQQLDCVKQRAAALIHEWQIASSSIDEI
jgi:hypothetical protein